MQRFYKRYLSTQRSRASSYLLNRGRRATTRKRVTAAISGLKRSYWKTMKNANLNDLFSLGILSRQRIKFKDFPILLLLVIYECVQLSFRNKLPYLVFLVIVLQSGVYLKNTTDLFDGYLSFLQFKSAPILSLEKVSNAKPTSVHFFSPLLLNALIHLSDLHLFMSLTNFLWKGSQLEIIFGKLKFALILITFTLLANAYFLLLNFFGYFCTLNEYFLRNSMCGFTPITFALKVLFINYEKEFRLKTNQNLRSSQERVSRSEENLIKEIILEACVVQTPIWFEFLCLFVILPKITFLSHASGILVGLTFIKTRFLKRLIDGLVIYLVSLFGRRESQTSSDSLFHLNRVDSPSLGKILVNNQVQLCLDQLRLKKTYYFE